MSIRLNYAVVHELVKEARTPETGVNLAPTLLGAEDPVVVDLVDRLVDLIGQRENMAHYGVFRDDAASTRVPSIVKSYCMEAGPTPDGFLSLTEDCMTALCDRAGSRNLATGGYLLFADYTNAGRRFLLVAMVKQRSGITMDGWYLPASRNSTCASFTKSRASPSTGCVSTKKMRRNDRT